MKKQLIIRQFVFDDLVLDDPNPDWTPEKVKTFYAPQYPSLTSALINEGKVKDGVIKFKFVTKVGING